MQESKVFINSNLTITENMVKLSVKDVKIFYLRI
jgi:hypothetical protein